MEVDDDLHPPAGVAAADSSRCGHSLESCPAAPTRHLNIDHLAGECMRFTGGDSGCTVLMPGQPGVPSKKGFHC